MRATHASATCPTCQTLFASLPVERDEDGGYVVLEVTACRECAALLCACCAQFACDGCGHVFCSSHLVIVPDGTPAPLRCCAACATECEPLALFPAAIAPARELRPALVAKGVA